jgi:hypothetical protein
MRRVDPVCGSGDVSLRRHDPDQVRWVSSQFRIGLRNTPASLWPNLRTAPGFVKEHPAGYRQPEIF